MSKQILMLFKFEEDQVIDLKEIATDYEVIFSIAEAEPEKLEIIVGWMDEATPLVAHENSNVKWIQFPYAGINTLPLELFDEKGIILSNGSGIHSAAGSESVMALILSYSRNTFSIQSSSEYTKQKNTLDKCKHYPVCSNMI